MKARHMLFPFLIALQSFIPLTAGVHEKALHDYKVDTYQTHVLNAAKNLPHQGVLKRKKNGYIYLDVANEFITKLLPKLILDGHLRPTQSFKSEEGAHISVVLDTETAEGLEDEIGQSFSFAVKELRTIKSTRAIGPLGSDRVAITGYRWVIAVESPELEELRMRSGLSPLINRKDFHITLGFEVPFCRINNFGERPR